MTEDGHARQMRKPRVVRQTMEKGCQVELLKEELLEDQNTYEFQDTKGKP